MLFCCRPAYGHVFPLLSLATACRDAGHEVVFGTGEGFVERLRGLGFPAPRVGIAIGEAQERALRAPRAAPDLLAYEETDVGAPVARRPHGCSRGDALAGAPDPRPRERPPAYLTLGTHLFGQVESLRRPGRRRAAERLRDEIAAVPAPADVASGLGRWAAGAR